MIDWVHELYQQWSVQSLGRRSPQSRDRPKGRSWGWVIVIAALVAFTGLVVWAS